MKALGMALMLWSTRQSEVSLPLLVVSQLLGGAGFTIALTTDAARCASSPQAISTGLCRSRPRRKVGCLLPP